MLGVGKHRERHADVQQGQVLHHAVAGVEGEQCFPGEQLRAPVDLFQNSLRDGRLITGVMPVNVPEFRKHADANGNRLVIPQKTCRE